MCIRDSIRAGEWGGGLGLAGLLRWESTSFTTYNVEILLPGLERVSLAPMRDFLTARLELFLS